jgi:hypothetical protein
MAQEGWDFSILLFDRFTCDMVPSRLSSQALLSVLGGLEHFRFYRGRSSSWLEAPATK